MLHSPEIQAMIDQEVSGTYATPDQRAAYRAGMSAAFTACDFVAREIDQRSKINRARSATAKLCGDMIEGLRERVSTFTDETQIKGRIENSC
jgi:hypothetical protein